VSAGAVLGRAARAGERTLSLARPRVAGALLAQLDGVERSDHEQLDATLEWLARAQDATGVGGVAARYDLASGWDRAYPETTGYIIGTMLHAADVTCRPELADRAVRMGEWLLEIQQPAGWIPGGLARDGGGRPEVFNTGQVLFGWLALHEVTGREDFAAAGARAAQWLAAVQAGDGSWVEASLHGEAHAYYSRVTWALARAGVVLNDRTFVDAATASIEWVCGQQRDGGWIDHMSFTEGAPALTHTIAYTIEGLLECALVLGHERAWSVAAQAMRSLAATYTDPGAPGRCARTGGLIATFTDGFVPADTDYECVTGSAQAALCARRLDALGGRPEHAEFADTLTEAVKRAQSQRGPAGVRGGVPGSNPIWGAYGSFKYLNWAAKFVADLLLDRVAGLPRARYG